MKISVLGVDPGKTGGLCLINNDGTRFKFWDMPTTAGGVCGVGLAEIYRQVQALCKNPPRVFIEKIFTKPTDAVKQADYDYARRLCDFLKPSQSDESGGGGPDSWSFARFLQEYGPPPTLPPVRLDGRVGNLNYAHGAGLLEMPHLWGWSITKCSPRTWCAVMHRGLPEKLPPKEKSCLYVSQRWPDLYRQGSDIWPGKTKLPSLGRLDALMIAEYGRQQL